MWITCSAHLANFLRLLTDVCQPQLDVLAKEKDPLGNQPPRFSDMTQQLDRIKLFQRDFKMQWGRRIERLTAEGR